MNAQLKGGIKIHFLFAQKGYWPFQQYLHMGWHSHCNIRRLTESTCNGELSLIYKEHFR